MPEKKKTSDRKEIHTVLAAAAMTLILTLWNAFAIHDRRKVEAAAPSTLLPASVAGTIADACPTPVSGRNIGARCMTVTRTRSS